MLNKYKITFNNISNQDESIYFSNEQTLIKLLKLTAKETGLKGKFVVSFNLVDSDDIRKLKKEHFGIDASTDVLSFPQMDTFRGTTDLGDIFINSDILETQAKEIGSDKNTEVLYLFMHGLLHLIGHDHIGEEDFKLMRTKEKEFFRKLNIRNEK